MCRICLFKLFRTFLTLYSDETFHFQKYLDAKQRRFRQTMRVVKAVNNKIIKIDYDTN